MGYDGIKLVDLRVGDLLEVINSRSIRLAAYGCPTTDIRIPVGDVAMFAGYERSGNICYWVHLLYGNRLWETWMRFDEERFWHVFRLVSRFDECD